MRITGITVTEDDTDIFKVRRTSVLHRHRTQTQSGEKRPPRPPITATQLHKLYYPVGRPRAAKADGEAPVCVQSVGLMLLVC